MNEQKNPYFEELFTPMQINKTTYRNRIVTAPMKFTMMAVDNPAYAEKAYAQIEAFARGGVAAVILGETDINYTDGNRINLPYVDFSVHSGPAFEVASHFAEVIKKHGAVALIELAHCGSMKDPFPGQKNPIGPVTYERHDGVKVEGMTEADMDRLSNEFATAALFMKSAGFDGVLIHGGHGFIFTQFLSPLTNTRDDAYGGEKLENRARFPLQVLKTIRAAVGEDFIIDVRLSAAENVPGGITPEMTGEFCKMMEGIVDSAHISAGLYDDPIRTHQFSCMFDPHGCNAELAAIVKRYTSLPVGVVGGINSPEFSEKILKEGMADYVILGRQMFADPEFAKKAQEGRANEIRRCLRCFNCFNGSPEEGYTDLPSAEERRKNLGACAINPKAKTKYDADILPPAGKPKKVLIVGGGVAGMQAAITCCERGHTVVLAEKGNKLGGLLNFTDIDVDKEDLRNFKNLLIADVERKGIDVRLNTEADEALIRTLAPDAIILAVGSRPVTPPIPGIEKAQQVLDIYEKGLLPGKKVIIVGGGLVGCEAALHLTKTGHEVIIIEMLHRVANDSCGNYRKALTLEMDKCGIQCFSKTKCLEIMEHGVRVAAKDGTERVLQGDTVLYGLGMKSISTEALKAAAGDIPCYIIGDCAIPGKVEAATNTAFNTAMAI